MRERLESSYSVPQTFSPFQGVNITYFLTQVDITPKKYAKVEADALIKALDPDNHVWETFPDNPKDQIIPPSDWQLSEDNGNLLLLNGFR